LVLLFEVEMIKI